MSIDILWHGHKPRKSFLDPSQARDDEKSTIFILCFAKNKSRDFSSLTNIPTYKLILFYVKIILMDEKQIRKIIKETAKETTRQNAILIEEIRSENKMVAESLSLTREVLQKDIKDLSKRVDNHFEEIGTLKVDMAGVKSDIVEMKEDISEIKGELKTMNNRVDNVEDSQEETTEKVIKIEKHLSLA